MTEDDVATTTETLQSSSEYNIPSTTNRPADIQRLDKDTIDFPITMQDVGIGMSEYMQGDQSDDGVDHGRKRRSTSAQKDDYDDKYERFKKSFNNRRARGNYRVEDSEDESAEDEDDSGDDDEESASEEHPKKNKKSKGSTSSDDDYDRIRDESQKAKKSKYCRVEKRGSMYCNVCHNPKNGDSAESCSYRQDPSGKKHTMTTKDKKHGKPTEEPEREREFVTTQRPYVRPRLPSPQRPIPAPAFRRPTFTMSYVPRYGYVFAPNRRPATRPPIPPRNNAYTRSLPKRYIFTGQESRPQREVVGVALKNQPNTDDDNTNYNDHTTFSLEDAFTPRENAYVNRLKKNHTNNDEDHDFHPKFSTKDGVDTILAEFKAKDWSKCQHSLKGELTCYMCQTSGGSKHEECVYDSSISNGNRPHYAELKSYRQSVFGSGDDMENYFINKNRAIIGKKPKKSMPKKVTTTRKPRIESSTTGDYILKNMFGEVEDHLTPEADLFPWDTTGSSVKLTKRMVTAAYHEDTANPDEAKRAAVYDHKVVHTVWDTQRNGGQPQVLIISKIDLKSHYLIQPLHLWF